MTFDSESTGTPPCGTAVSHRNGWRKLEAVREVLTSGGRTLAPGALAWLWARSPQAIPIPGFRNVRQVEESCGAVAFGPLRPEQMAESAGLLACVP